MRSTLSWQPIKTAVRERIVSRSNCIEWRTNCIAKKSHFGRRCGHKQTKRLTNDHIVGKFAQPAGESQVGREDLARFRLQEESSIFPGCIWKVVGPGSQSCFDMRNCDETRKRFCPQAKDDLHGRIPAGPVR